MASSLPAPQLDTQDRPARISVPTSSTDDVQIGEIVERLGRRYPREQVPQAVLEDRTRGFYRDFDTARVRTYIPLFVERLVRRSIERPSTRPAG